MSLKGIFPVDKWDFQSNTILSELNTDEYARLMRHAVEKPFKKSEIIFREGAVPTGIYYIMSGMVKKYKIDNEGKEHIIYVANTGELFGYHAVLANEPYSDAAATLEDSTICFIPTEDFLAILDSSVGLSKKLLKILSHEFTVLTNNISVFAQRSVRERIAIALIILREKFKYRTKEDKPILIRILREDIANMAGTTRENVARTLTEFRQEGIIELSGRTIEVIDINKLVDVSNYVD